MTSRLECMLLSLLAVLAAVYCFRVRSPEEPAALLLIGAIFSVCIEDVQTGKR